MMPIESFTVITVNESGQNSLEISLISNIIFFWGTVFGVEILLEIQVWHAIVLEFFVTTSNWTMKCSVLSYQTGGLAMLTIVL